MAATGAGWRSPARLLHSPKLLLLDEPTVGLDVPTRTAIVRHIHELARTDNIGVLWATHLFDEIEPDDDLLVLNRGASSRAASPRTSWRRPAPAISAAPSGS